MARMIESTDANRIVWLVGNHGRIEGRTRLQKIVFLLMVEEEINFSFDFIPYYYGPYSDDLSEYVEDLISYGFLVEKRTRLSNDVYRYDYELTESGKDLLNKIQETTVPGDMKQISKYIASIKNTPTTELVAKAKEMMAEEVGS